MIVMKFLVPIVNYLFVKEELNFSIKRVLKYEIPKVEENFRRKNDFLQSDANMYQ